MSGKYGEPWTLYDSGAYGASVRDYETGGYILEAEDAIDETTKAQWLRICHAVNALAGIPDSSLDAGCVEVVREALEQARGALLLDHMVDDAGQPFGTTTVALEAIDAALSLLIKEPKP